MQKVNIGMFYIWGGLALLFAFGDAKILTTIGLWLQHNLSVRILLVSLCSFFAILSLILSVKDYLEYKYKDRM